MTVSSSHGQQGLGCIAGPGGVQAPRPPFPEGLGGGAGASAPGGGRVDGGGGLRPPMAAPSWASSSIDPLNSKEVLFKNGKTIEWQVLVTG